jgi:hypothetical protein
MDDYKPLLFILIYLVMAFLKKNKKKADQRTREQDVAPPQEKKKQSMFDFQNMIENLKEEVQKEVRDSIREVPYMKEPVVEAVLPKPIIEKKVEAFSEGSTPRPTETSGLKKETNQVRKPSEIKSVLDRLGRHSPLAQGIIMSEILGKPVSLRE